MSLIVHNNGNKLYVDLRIFRFLMKQPTTVTSISTKSPMTNAYITSFLLFPSGSNGASMKAKKHISIFTY